MHESLMQLMYGFGIALHIQTVSENLLRVEEGSLYPALHRLERDKFVKASWTQTENGRRARIYKLTAAGRQRRDRDPAGNAADRPYDRCCGLAEGAAGRPVPRRG